MKEKSFHPGDKVKLKTRGKVWEGHLLQSHDPEVLLLKLKSGYNIGIREKDVVSATCVAKVKPVEKEVLSLDKRQGLRNVALVITGGTISSRLDPTSGGVISTDAEEILRIAPEIAGVCNIVRIEKPFMKFSEDMGPSDWQHLAKVCGSLLNDEGVDGVILTQGTDTLHFTSAALTFFLGSLNKPLAVTYAQRSIDRGSTDAHLNLLCAARYAVSDIAQVAVVGHGSENDDFCLAIPGTVTRKMHASARATFQAINAEPLAKISEDKMEILSSFHARNDKKVTVDTRFCEDVAILRAYPGSDPSLIDYYVGQGYKGLIIEVTGLGQVPGKDAHKNWLPKIKKAVSKGVVVCATAQTIFGSLNPHVYASGRALQKTGILFLDDMLTETAYVKLGFVLGHKDWDAGECMLHGC